MPLEGYFDDSGSHEGRNVDYVCVLGGFISTVENWKAFSAAWATKLDEFPPIRYFRMSEAMSLTGQFARGWTPQLRDQRLLELAQIVKAHALVRVDCTIKRGWYNSIIKFIEENWDDPYYLLFGQLLWAVQDYQMQHDNVGCDVILDVQGQVGEKLLSGWKRLQDYEPNKIRRKLMDNPPVFRDDRQFLPLQAADLYAWLVRDHLSRLIREKRNPRMPKRRIILGAIAEQFKDMEFISRELDFDAMMRIGARMMVERAKRLGLFG